MRVLDDQTKKTVQATIDQNIGQLKAVPGFVSAEPGFPIVDGGLVREPAVIVFVAHKRPPDSVANEDRVPRQLGEYRVAVMQASPMQQLEALSAADRMSPATSILSTLSVKPENLTYKALTDNPIDQQYVVSTPFLCHVGPDAGWPVLKPFLQAAQVSLSVAMYDFNADYISKVFIDCIRDNSLKAQLTWDNSMTAPETEIRAKLKRVPELTGGIVQTGSGCRFASAYHEKVAVRDSKSFWLSSGNWSLRSQPNIDPIGTPAQAKGMYSKANREWHIIVEDEKLAQMYEKYIEVDLKASQAAAAAGDPRAALDRAALPEQMPDLFVPIESIQEQAALAVKPVEPIAPKRLPSTPREVRVAPLLTPDNYVDRITKMLSKVQKSVYLQFAYINYSDKPQDKKFADMLAILGKLSWKQGVDVRIILGNNGSANQIRLLAQSGFNEKVFKSQSNIHNKGIIVDGVITLVSSANWSGDGVLRNRDAGLLIEDEEVAAYYQDTFLYDWDNRASARVEDDPPVVAALENEPTPAGMARMTWRDYYS